MHQNPVTRLSVITVELTNGTKFQIVTDLIDTVDNLINRWKRKTKRPTAMSLIMFIKERKPYCICVTKEQYDEVTAGKVVPATKEEWEAENN